MRRILPGAWLAIAVAAGACGSSSETGGGVKADGGTDAGPGAGVDAGAEASEDAGAGTGTDARADADAGTDASANAGADVDAGPDAGMTLSVYVTAYGWADNDPPGPAIAYPKNGGFATAHNAAGGTGTFADPITFATDKSEFAPGTVLYVPFIEKYVIMEDDCAECDTDWSAHQKHHIDIWMNSSAAESTNALIQCEDSWTRTAADVEANPPPSRAVTTAPLFDPATNTCRTAP